MDAGPDIVDCMTRMRGDHQPFALATVVRTEDATATKAGAKAVIRADGSIVGWIGGGCTLEAVRRAAVQALNDGKAHLIRVRPEERADEDTLAGMDYYANHCASGGTMEIFIEPILPKPVLLVLGASPTARALIDLGSRLGFAVAVAAAGDDQVGLERADMRLGDFHLAALPRLEEAFVVVSTQGRHDGVALEAALASPARYVAFVGSRRKAEALLHDAMDSGLDPALAGRLKFPAGLDIGATTPEEIALSILAEIVQLRRRGELRTGSADHKSASGTATDEHRRGSA